MIFQRRIYRQAYFGGERRAGFHLTASRVTGGLPKRRESRINVDALIHRTPICTPCAEVFYGRQVKNCHLSRTKGLAEFPDCVAARSTKHLRELETMAAAGERAVVLFVVQRTDCDGFRACAELDPRFAAALDHAAAAGVEVLVYTAKMSLTAVTLSHRIPWTPEA